MQYVTYEAMFAFIELIFSAICAGASVTALTIAIVKLKSSDSKNKRKK